MPTIFYKHHLKEKGRKGVSHKVKRLGRCHPGWVPALQYFNKRKITPTISLAVMLKHS